MTQAHRLIRPLRTTGMVTALALTCAACATQQPAAQLSDARATYEDVNDGDAQAYAPDELLEAKNLLTRAEQAENGSPEQVHLAYLADRQARLAASSGKIEHYEKDASEAKTKYISAMEQRSMSAQEQLEATQQELAEVSDKMQQKDANVEELEARKSELEARRTELESKLSASEEARKNAEERAAAAMASLEKLASVKEEANETVITLSGSVLFKTGEAELLPVAENSLDKVADAIKTMDDESQIVVEGYTDSRGGEQMNRELSQKRAESVMNYLATQGVTQDRMKAVGKGEANPVASNDSPEGRANNRRVELRISEKGKSAKAKGSTPKAGDTEA